MWKFSFYYDDPMVYRLLLLSRNIIWLSLFLNIDIIIIYIYRKYILNNIEQAFEAIIAVPLEKWLRLLDLYGKICWFLSDTLHPFPGLLSFSAIRLSLLKQTDRQTNTQQTNACIRRKSIWSITTSGTTTLFYSQLYTNLSLWPFCKSIPQINCFYILFE